MSVQHARVGFTFFLIYEIFLFLSELDLSDLSFLEGEKNKPCANTNNIGFISLNVVGAR